MTDTNKPRLIALDSLPQLVCALSCRNILLLADPVVWDANDLSLRLAPLFQCAVVKKIEVAAKLLTVESLAKTDAECEGFRPDIIIMVGGGTVLDTGKMINIMNSCELKADELAAYKPTEGSALTAMAAIPTTAGTGSECTHFAVLYKNSNKYSVADPNLVPNYVILAPEITLSMPAKIAAYTGMDAFSQAIESFWSVNSTEESRKFSREALSLIRNNFIDSVLQHTLKNRSAMQRAAFLSGKAINIAQTTASHAISYPLSSIFGLPHGLAVFLTLPSIYAFNLEVTATDCVDPRGTAHVCHIMAELGELIVTEETTNPVETLRSYFEALSIGSRLTDHGFFSDEAIDRILDNGFNPQRMKNNPRRISRANLQTIIREIL
jgi:alcohol dehydrogenase class IV